MVLTVRTSADGKRGRVSMLSALRAMRESMPANVRPFIPPPPNAAASAGLLQHQSSLTSDISFREGTIPNRLSPTSNPDLSHPGSNGGAEKSPIDRVRSRRESKASAVLSARLETEVALQQRR